MGGNDPPKLKTGDVYSSWKRKVAIWQCGTTLEETKQASRVIQALEGKALDFATRIPLETVKAANGVKLVLIELDKHFKKDETQTAFITIENLENYKRTDESISEYIEEFCRRRDLVEECESLGKDAYKDGILAYRLLKQASLTPSETQLIRATIIKLTFDNMVIAMKKTLGDVVIMEGSSYSAVPIKEESTYLAELEHEVQEEHLQEDSQFYGNNFRSRGNYRGSYRPYNSSNNYGSYNNRSRGYQNYSGRGNSNSFRGYNNRGNYNRYQNNNDKSNSKASQNPVDRYTGKVATCGICKSIYHFQKDCPDAKPAQNERTYFQKASEQYEIIDDDYDAVLLVEGTQRRALIDSGCVTSVCGGEWLNDYLKTCKFDRSQIVEVAAKKNFRFGDGRLQESTRILTLPIHLCGKDLELQTFVIEGEIPLLLSRTALKEYGASIDFKNDLIVIDGISQTLKVNDSGHYVIDIDRPIESKDIVLLCNGEKDAKKTAIKLHRYFGHPSSQRLMDMVKESDLDQRILKHIKDMECETCLRFKRERPKPKSSMMMSSEFNEIVSLDLKKLSTGDIMIHMVDLFSRFSATGIVKNKHQDTIVNAMFKIWISIFGRPKLVYSDNGGEFVNESFVAVCEDLGVTVKTTAANSPFSNGICERHNGLIAEAFDKIIEDVKCKAEVALAWATNAKNSYSNTYGYSPYILVFGKTPHIPGLDDIKLVTELNDSTVSKMLADHLNAMYLSRQAYMKAMQSDRLKRALKDRITFQDEKYFLGDQVYFKRKDLKRWCGPATVIGQDGKIVIVRQGGFDLRVHASRVVLRTRADQEILGVNNKSSDNSEKDKAQDNNGLTQSSVAQDNSTESSESEEDEVNRNVVSVGNDQTTEDQTSEEQTTEEQTSEVQVPSVTSSSVWKSISLKRNGVLDIQKGDKIRMRETEDDDWEEAVVTGPGGTVRGSNKNLFNLVKGDDTEHHCHLDKLEVEKSTEPIMYIEDCKTYVVNIPRERYNEPAIQAAMDVEMQRWKEYNTYREINDRGQKTISTRWVITEKKTGFKARLVVRGFEEVEDVGQADSPTGDKATLRFVLALAASENWKLQSIDIKSAYLQADNLDREVFVRPPKELKRPGLIWQLDKPAYGLIDSAKNWYCSISNFLTSLGCKKCIYDKALFSYSINNKLCGIVLMHVDDFIFCGSQRFLNEVLKPLKMKYDISKHEQETFKYIGIDIVQTDSAIILDQKQYIQCVQPVIVKATRQQCAEERLTKEEQTQYLSLLGKISWLAQITRPDLKFDVYQYAKHNKNTTIQNLLDLNGVVSKVYKQQRSMYFIKLDRNKPWKLAVYADASFANLDNKVNSARGYLVLLCDGERACILTWNANKVSRVVTSVLESETLALRDGIRHAELLRTVICTVKYGSADCDKGVLPIIGFTDSDQLWKSVHSTKRCKDVALHRDICVIQEKITEGILSEIRHVRTDDQIADCLTKKGASPKKLALLVETGVWRV